MLPDSIYKQRVTGLLFMIALGVFVWMSFAIDDEGNLFADPYDREYRCLLKDTARIEEGSVVTQYGNRAGRVDATRLVKMDDHFEAEVVFTMKDPYQVREDSEAKLEMQSFLQGAGLSVTGGSPGAKLLEPGRMVKTAPATTVNDAFAKLGVVLNGVQDGGLGRMFLGDDGLAKTGVILDTVSSDGGLGKWILGETAHAHLKPITNDLLQSVTNIRKGTEGEGLLARLLHDATLGETVDELVSDLRAGMKGVRKLATDISGSKSALARLASDEELGATISEAFNGFHFGARGLAGRTSVLSILARDEELGDGFGVAVASVSKFAGDLNDGKGLIPMLVKEPDLYADAVAIVQQLRESIEDVREAYPINLMSETAIDSAPAALIP